MRCLPLSIRNSFLSAVAVSACLALESCGTTCVAGIFNNGNGVILIKNSTPPPACPPSMGMGMMTVATSKSQVCEICTASSRAQHIFVTLKSIQLHSISPVSPNSPDWLEIAPHLVREPRQIDLLSSSPEILVQTAPVPAGTYRELLLRFLTETQADPETLASDNPCGYNRRNCLVLADGRVEDLYFTGNGDPTELLLPLRYNGSSALAIVPGGTVEVGLTLEPQQISSVSPSEGWRIHYALVGNASVSR